MVAYGSTADARHEGLGFGAAPESLGEQALGHLYAPDRGVHLLLRLGDELLHHVVEDRLFDRAEVGDLSDHPLDLGLGERLQDASRSFLAHRDQQQRRLAGAGQLQFRHAWPPGG